MLNEQVNVQLAKQLADRTNRPVAIWTNSRGQVNIQFAGKDPIESFTTLCIVIDPEIGESRNERSSTASRE